MTTLRRDEVTPLPRFLQLEPVGQCNLRCRMCPVQFRQDAPAGGGPSFLAFDTFRALIDQFDGLTELHLQGLGEPTMHPQFFDMVSYASARGIEVSTNSNMTVLSERRASQCVASGLRRVYASVDGASAATYEFIRVGARFERVVRNIRRLAAARAAAGSTYPEIRLVAVAMRRNLDELPALVALAHELGSKHLSVQHLCHDFSESTLPAHYRPMRGFVDAQTLLNEDPGRVEKVFDAARARARDLGVELRLPRTRPRAHPQETPGRARCDWPWRGAYLSYSGEAMPCCMVSTPDRVSLGNMTRDGVAAVWSGAAYADFRRALDEGPPPEVCRGCSLYHGTF